MKKRTSAIIIAIWFMISNFASADETITNTANLKIHKIKSIKDTRTSKEQKNNLPSDVKIPSAWKKVTKPAKVTQKNENATFQNGTNIFVDPLEAKWHKNPNIKPSNNVQIKERTESKNSDGFQSSMPTLPTDFRMVGEFEEMQAVCVSIPTYMLGEIDEGAYQGLYQLIFDCDFNGIMDQYHYEYGVGPRTIDVQIPPGCAVFWPWGLEIDGADFNEVYLVPEDLVYHIPNIGFFNNQDGTKDTTVAYLWGKLIYEIQQAGAQAWIRCNGTYPYDTTYVKEYFAEIGYPLTNYKFFISGLEDAFWMRDFGVFGIYYKDDTGNEKLGFIDAKYYTGRAFDDEYNKIWMDSLGYDYYDLDVKMEGGNIMNDGWKKADGGFGTYGDVIYANNGGYTGSIGQYYWDETNEQWYADERIPITQSQTDARMSEAFNFTPNVITSLQYDGGTGHIDLWIKQFDEETMLIADMPEKYRNMVDYKIIQQNRAKLSELKTVYGTNYRFLNAPMPRLDNGRDMPIDNEAYDADPRSYLNGVTVNKSYIYPSFSFKPGDVNWDYEQQNKAILEKLLPGYKLVPIDARVLTPAGGAIHCITMQIPANPDSVITIRHKPVRDYQPIADAFPIEVELVTNIDCSDFVVEAAIWLKNENTYKYILLTPTNADKKHWTGNLLGEIDWSETDTVRYNIVVLNTAEDAIQDGTPSIVKTAPITGPDSLAQFVGLNNEPAFGYYDFWFNTTSIDQLYGFEPKSNSIASIYPNPVINTSTINIIMENINAGNISIDIMNSMGQIITSPVQNKHFAEGVWTIDINIGNLSAGAYFIKMQTQNGTSVANFVVK